MGQYLSCARGWRARRPTRADRAWAHCPARGNPCGTAVGPRDREFERRRRTRPRLVGAALDRDQSSGTDRQVHTRSRYPARRLLPVRRTSRPIQASRPRHPGGPTIRKPGRRRRGRQISWAPRPNRGAGDDVPGSRARRCSLRHVPAVSRIAYAPQGVEDFGIVPVEAMACGTPVLAVSQGGALDTVWPGVTGEFVRPGSDDEVVEALAIAMSTFDAGKYDAATIRTHAEGSAPAAFRARMAEVVANVVAP